MRSHRRCPGRSMRWRQRSLETHARKRHARITRRLQQHGEGQGMLRVCAAHLQHLRCVSQRAAALAEPAPAARCCLSAQILYSLPRHCSTTAWPALHVSRARVCLRDSPPARPQKCKHVSNAPSLRTYSQNRPEPRKHRFASCTQIEAGSRTATILAVPPWGCGDDEGRRGGRSRGPD